MVSWPCQGQHCNSCFLALKRLPMRLKSGSLNAQSYASSPLPPRTAGSWCCSAAISSTRSPSVHTLAVGAHLRATHRGAPSARPRRRLRTTGQVHPCAGSILSSGRTDDSGRKPTGHHPWPAGCTRDLCGAPLQRDRAVVVLDGLTGPVVTRPVSPCCALAPVVESSAAAPQSFRSARGTPEPRAHRSTLSQPHTWADDVRRAIAVPSQLTACHPTAPCGHSRARLRAFVSCSWLPAAASSTVETRPVRWTS